MVSEIVTNCIRVKVQAFYLPERSKPERHQYLYAYRIRITNEGDAPAKLISRHWIITDAMGGVEEVEGMGVVGEQPRILPGESYEYSSACPLRTQFGVMRGTYTMNSDDGEAYDIEVSPFTMYIPALNN